MKFGVSVENASGQGQLKSILQNSYFGWFRGPKNAEMFAIFSVLEIGKLSWVHLSSNANEI